MYSCHFYNFYMHCSCNGYYFANSEMGHLYYTELDNPGYQHLDGGSCVANPAGSSSPPFGLQNTAPFQNLVTSFYWTGTEHAAVPNDSWFFNFYYGYQDRHSASIVGHDGYGLALRSGQVVSGSIPTLSEWGQILLVVMLGVSALWMKRRQSMVV